MPPAKRQRQPGHSNGRQPQHATMSRLMGAHDSAIERLKAALTVILFVPKAVHDIIEGSAKHWKDRNKPGEEHPDRCSCTCARLKALLDGLDKALAGNNPLLTATPAAKEALQKLVAVVAEGAAHLIVADISLKVAGSRTPDQSPYEITFASSTEGHLLRAALRGISQPDGTPNTKEQPVKSWEEWVAATFSFQPLSLLLMLYSSDPQPAWAVLCGAAELFAHFATFAQFFFDQVLRNFELRIRKGVTGSITQDGQGATLGEFAGTDAAPDELKAMRLTKGMKLRNIKDDTEVEACAVLAPMDLIQVDLLFVDHQLDLPQIYERRTTPKAKKAAEFFLQNINPEVILQIAMMCDAAQEELDLSLVSQFVIDITKAGLQFSIQPTFVWGDKNEKNEHLLKSLKGMGAVLTDCWQQASVHIVDDVAKPGQRVSWSARLGGHLLATPRLGNGPYEAAGKIRTPRHLLISSEFNDLHPAALRVRSAADLQAALRVRSAADLQAALRVRSAADLHRLLG
eukprot:s794_g6.t1